MTKQSVQRAVLLMTFAVICGALALRPMFDARVSAQTPPATEKNPYLVELEKQIAGREDKPAEEVFKNIQLFKGMPAGRVLRVMNLAFAASLGVDCTHCHVPGEWEKETKPQKETARKMWELMIKFNKDLKETIGTGMVNCTTCHRGQVKPALNLPAAK